LNVWTKILVAFIAREMLAPFPVFMTIRTGLLWALDC